MGARESKFRPSRKAESEKAQNESPEFCFHLCWLTSLASLLASRNQCQEDFGTMNGLPLRHRFICFLSVAAPALSAFLLGRLLANCSSIFRSYYEGGGLTTPLPALTRILLAVANSGFLVRAGEIAAIAIASIGFLLVHRLAPDRAVRSVLVLVLIVWSVEVALLMGSLIAFASPLTSR